MRVRAWLRAGTELAASPQQTTPSHLPSLDGLRACAILLVLVGHLGHTTNFPVRIPTAALGDLGNLGVRIFFVLSGFLITHLLLREERRTGTISLRRFYLRRALRIFPAFYVFLLALWMAHGLGWIPFPGRDQWAAATYTMNFLRDRGWYAGHTWSLAVEEQFYLLWPGIFLLAGPRRRNQVVIGAMIAAPLFRIAILILLPSWQLTIGEAFPTVMDTIATGAALALLQPYLRAIPRYRSLIASNLVYLLPFAIVAINALDAHWSWPGWLAGETLLNVMIAVGVDRALQAPHGPIGCLLNLRAIAWIGTLSYSLYLWQQPFMIRGGVALVQRFPWNLGFAAVAAVASHWIVEQPFLRLKDRIGGSVVVS